MTKAVGLERFGLPAADISLTNAKTARPASRRHPTDGPVAGAERKAARFHGPCE